MSNNSPDFEFADIEADVMSDGVVNKTFISMMEAMGYDIELTYVKRKPD
ncbi:hypothetical protein [Atopobacter sp. AH10]|nr:hypothetical protein [Atopobacter sp. AH10]